MEKDIRKQAADFYREISLRSAGKIKSLILLVEGAIRFLRQGLEYPGQRKTSIIKTQNILVQLQMALNLQAGEIPQNMFGLYDYLFELLMEEGDAQIKSAISLLEGLLSVFRDVDKKTA